MVVREPEVEARVRRYLVELGYVLSPRKERTGPDITAMKNGRKLLVEAKGDRPGHQSSSATINVDVLTLLGQILLRKGQRLADDYAIPVRPIHIKLLNQAIPALKEISVKVFLVTDTDVQTVS